MAKGRFGGDTYKPKQLGPEPAQPVAPAAEGPAPTPAAARHGVRTRILSDKVVPFSSRITPATQENLVRLVERTGRSVTHLLDEALSDLFAKHRRDLA
jgi:Ribbon-helix-helix domain